MGIIDRVRTLLGRGENRSFGGLSRVLGGDGDEDAEHVCLKCGAALHRPHRECPECGNPYVTSTDDEAG